MAKDVADDLFAAASTGALSPFRKASDESIQRGYLGGDTQSYLHLAARHGHVALCELLIARGIDVNRTADVRWGGTPLQLAAAHGHIAVVRCLLAHDAKVDGVAWSMATPLMDAAREGHVDIVRLLLDHGADIHREGLGLPQTALDFALAYQSKGEGQVDVARLLRERGGYQPYFERHDWSAYPHRARIEAVERALAAIVNPLALNDGDVAIHRARIPKRYDHQLLFTCGRRGGEACIVLPSAWPLHRAALAEPRFAAPVRWLLARTPQGPGELIAPGDGAWPNVPVLSVAHEALPADALYVPLKRTVKDPVAAADKYRSKAWRALAFAPFAP